MVVRTSTAEKHSYRCPACGDDLKQDNTGKGFVAHVSNPHCLFEKGEKDGPGAPSVARATRRPDLAPHEPADGVRVCGYSERGIFNALLYDVGFAADPIGVLRAFLALVRVPGSTTDFSDLQGAEVLIEQSLSQFGDADAILLLHGPSWRSVLFAEGKVKTSQAELWTVHRAWSAFLARKEGKLESSNLFTQLYHKVRFIAALRDGGSSAVESGVAFPTCSRVSPRKIGSNPVVRRAARMVEDYSQQAFYIAVVPDPAERMADFFDNELQGGPGEDVSGWDTSGWGYLTWEQVETFCREHQLANTLRVFEFNRGQIY
jgi:hypothetical protein